MLNSFYRKSWIYILSALLLASTTAAHAQSAGGAPSGASATAPQFSRIFSYGVQLVRQSHEPSACGADYDGEITMNAKAQICVCDGENHQWKNVGTGSECAW